MTRSNQMTGTERGRLWGPALAAVATVTLALSAGTASASAASALYVASGAGPDPACAAASQANPFHTIAGALACAPNGATIHIGAGTFDGRVTVSHDVVLSGAGVASTSIARPSGAGLDPTPLISIPDGRKVTVRDLTVDGGDQVAQGIVAGSGALHVIDARLTGNGAHASAGGGAISVLPGSGKANVSVSGSTIDANQSDSYAGGVYLSSPGGATPSTLTVVNSTLTGNDGQNGGAIALGNASLSVRDSTIAGNGASSGAGVYAINGPAPITLADTILAANSPSDCHIGSRVVTDLGHNVVGTDCPGLADGVNGSQVGTAASPLDPVLAPLAANGGPTPTMAPLPGSPAIDAGSATDCDAAPVSGLDQRGMPRDTADRAQCDTGAYDTGGVPVETLYVSAKATGDPACADASKADPFKSIAAAVACAHNGATIKIGAGTFPGLVTLDRNVVLLGAGASTVITGPRTIDPTWTTIPSDVAVAPGRIVTVRGVTLDGRASNSPGVSAGAGSLTVIDSTITRNGFHATGIGGGGLSVDAGSGEAHVTVLRSTIDHNLSDANGGGIAVAGSAKSTLDVIDSTLTANQGGGGGAGGGALYVSQAQTGLRDSTLAGNFAGNGGGLFMTGGLVHVKLTNTILAANNAANGADCQDASNNELSDGGHNVVGQVSGDFDTGCVTVLNGSNGDHVGTPANPLDPGLAPLAANGGPTRTMALLSTSPALGGGNVKDCQAAPVDGVDQRGVSRSPGARHTCDIGAYDTGGAGF